jgi:hypothetical protein
MVALRWIDTSNSRKWICVLPERRQRAAQFIKEHRDVFRRHIIAWGFVSTKGVIRGALTAIAWLRAFPVPMDVFATRRECDAWLEERLAADSKSGSIVSSADD